MAITMTRNEHLKIEAAQHQILGVTFTKVSQVAMGVFSSLVGGTGLVLSGAITYLGVATPLLPITCLMIAAGSLLFYVALSTKDYHNQEELESYREEVRDLYDTLVLESRDQRSPYFRQNAISILSEVSKKHGWESMFYYGIPDPELFDQIYRFQAEMMTSDELISFYMEVQTAYQAARLKYGANLFEFQIPHPREFADKWRSSVKEQVVCSNELPLVMRFDLDQLQEFGLITPGTATSFKAMQDEYLEAKELFDRETKVFRETYENQVAPYIARKREKEYAIDQRFRACNSQEDLHQRRLEQSHAMRELKRVKGLDPEYIAAHKRFKVVENGIQLGVRDKERFLRGARQELEQAKARVDARFQGREREIEERFCRLKKVASEALKSAMTRQQEDLAAAYEEFQSQTEVIRSRHELAIREPQNRFHNVVSRIGRQTKALLA